MHCYKLGCGALTVVHRTCVYPAMTTPTKISYIAVGCMAILISTKTLDPVINYFTKGRRQLIPTSILIVWCRSNCVRNERRATRSSHHNFFNTTASNCASKHRLCMWTISFGSSRLTDANGWKQRRSECQTMNCDVRGGRELSWFIMRSLTKEA